MNEQDLLDRLRNDPLATVAAYYGSRLVQNARAVAFLEEQCLSSDAALRVGFGDRTLGKQLPSHHSKPGKEIRRFLQTAGILKPTGHEVFRGHVRVPLTLIDGDVTGMFGMRIDRNGPGDQFACLGSGFFNVEALTKFREIIVCDSVLDAWTFCGAGHRNAVAAEGCDFSEELFKNLKRILLANIDLKPELLRDRDVLRLSFPFDTTIHQYVLENKGDSDLLGARIRAATWVSGESKPARIPDQPTASPVPKPTDDLPIECNENEATITIDDRRWRIRGLDRNTTTGVMKVNVMVFDGRADRFHVDTLDLYHARSRRAYVKEAADELGANEEELRRDLQQTDHRIFPTHALSPPQAKRPTVGLDQSTSAFKGRSDLLWLAGQAESYRLQSGSRNRAAKATQDAPQGDPLRR